MASWQDMAHVVATLPQTTDPTPRTSRVGKG
jgi:hypothetical protein